jgi:hypothetical protein
MPQRVGVDGQGNWHAICCQRQSKENKNGLLFIFIVVLII